MKKEFIGQLTFSGLILLFIVLTTFFNHAMAQDYHFDNPKWIIKNTENNHEIDKRLTIQDESKVLHLPKSCIALLDQNFSDFTIEYDVKGGSMPGLGFRSNTLYDYEYFYLRMMNGGKNTAIQYFPVFNGAEAWTIYNYPKYESVAAFSEDKWTHVKVQVYGATCVCS